jgi:hypothetical protein
VRATGRAEPRRAVGGSRLRPQAAAAWTRAALRLPGLGKDGRHSSVPSIWSDQLPAAGAGLPPWQLGPRAGPSESGCLGNLSLELQV